MAVATAAGEVQREVRLFRVAKNGNAARESRRHLMRRLGRDHPLLDDALTCLNELVSNAIRHTRSGSGDGDLSWFKVHLDWTTTSVVVGVEDTGNDPGQEMLPRIITPEPDSESGRGLAIVAELSCFYKIEDGHIDGSHRVSAVLRTEVVEARA